MPSLIRRIAHVVSSRYYRIFSIAEIESHQILQWMMGAILLFFFVTFYTWASSFTITTQNVRDGRAVCWPYFQNCADWYFLTGLPDGYSQTTLYMACYGIMLLVVYWMWKKNWTAAHAGILLMYLWKMLVVFFFSYLGGFQFDYYHLIFTTVFLFAKHKEYFLKIAVVLLYFMAVTTKFDDTWILGTYFSSLQAGLPWVPQAFIPFATNFVIFSQVVFAWFLLSHTRVLQRAALGFFTGFHLYSGILVLYRYPTAVLPALLILFGPMYRYSKAPFDRASMVGWFFMLCIVLFHLPPIIIEGDRRLTLEGNRFGMYMFEANHQCVATLITRTPLQDAASVTEMNIEENCNGLSFTPCRTSVHEYEEERYRVREERWESSAAWNRCDPYEWWSYSKARCRNNSDTATALTVDHSINGGPFYRIVDASDACALEYQPFRHNEWIKMQPEAPIVGYPVKNGYPANK